MIRCLLLLTISLLTGGCASFFGVEREPLPSRAQIRSFVADNWTSHSTERMPPYASLFRSEAHPGETARLIEVRNIWCDYFGSMPECWFDIRAAFSDGHPLQRHYKTNFSWTADGALEEPTVLVLAH
ncbi:hypothetical protein [Brevundimonas sp.]|uniref:hypothetical protein n=1 Tax=Brevundimonas sp. TaxID=1871086 RepID=UPI002EDB62A9